MCVMQLIKRRKKERTALGVCWLVGWSYAIDENRNADNAKWAKQHLLIAKQERKKEASERNKLGDVNG